MINVEILLPVSANGKYYQRMLDFQQYGLLNYKGLNIHLTLLCGTEDPSLFHLGWDYPVTVVSSKYNHVASKIYDYYANLPIEAAKEIEWFLRVDDDSVTDIGGLYNWLSHNYSFSDYHHLVTRMCFGSPKEYRNEYIKQGHRKLLVSEKKGKNTWKEIVNFVPHEWECSVTSREAMLKVLYSGSAKRYLETCAEFKTGFGDIALAAALRIVGISASESEVLTQLPKVKQFSLFGGTFFHIHYLAHDLPKWKKFLKKYKKL